MSETKAGAILLLLLCVAALAGKQTGNTGEDKRLSVLCSGLPAEIVDFITTNKLEVFTTPNNPIYIVGNLDGNGTPDYALWIAQQPEDEGLPATAILVVFWNGTTSDTTVIKQHDQEALLNSVYNLAHSSQLAEFYHLYEPYRNSGLQIFEYYHFIPSPPFGKEGVYLGINHAGDGVDGDYCIDGAYYYRNRFYYLYGSNPN